MSEPLPSSSAFSSVEDYEIVGFYPNTKVNRQPKWEGNQLRIPVTTEEVGLIRLSKEEEEECKAAFAAAPKEEGKSLGHFKADFKLHKAARNKAQILSEQGRLPARPTQQQTPKEKKISPIKRPFSFGAKDKSEDSKSAEGTPEGSKEATGSTSKVSSTPTTPFTKQVTPTRVNVHHISSPPKRKSPSAQGIQDLQNDLEHLKASVFTTPKGTKNFRVYNEEIDDIELTSETKRLIKETNPKEAYQRAKFLYKANKATEKKAKLLRSLGFLPEDDKVYTFSNNFELEDQDIDSSDEDTVIGDGEDNFQNNFEDNFEDNESKPEVFEDAEDNDEATMADKKFNEWTIKWDIFSKTLNKFEDSVKKAIEATPPSQGQLQRRLFEIEEFQKEFDELAREFSKLAVSDEDDRNKGIEAIATAKSSLRHNKSVLAYKLKSLNPDANFSFGNFNSTSNPQPSTSKALLRLPKIVIKEFDGKFYNWLAFKDMFEQSVIKIPDAELAPVQKFHLLKQFLGPEPLKVIQAIPLSNDNFDRAWEAIKDRYDNKNRLTQEYIKDLDRLQPLTYKSSYKLRSNFDQVNNAREALRVLGQNVDQWDTLLITKFVSTLDQETRVLYEVGSQDETVDWAKLKKFVETMCRAWDIAKPPYQKDQQQSSSKSNSSKPSKSTTSLAVQSQHCARCNDSHPLWKCETFIKEHPEKRREFVRSKGLCSNCLSRDHKSKDCKSQRTCTKCQKRHHTLIHLDNFDPKKHLSPRNSSSPPKKEKEEKKEQVSSNAASINSFASVILPTARVLVEDSYQQQKPLRALLDTGSESSFISEKAVNLLGLKRHRINMSVGGIGDQKATTAKGFTEITIHSSHDPEFKMVIPVLILPRCTGRTPTMKVNGNWDHIEGLPLADPHYNIPADVDLLLSTNVTLRVLKGSAREAGDDSPVAVNSVFGWVIAGNSAFRSYNKVLANVSNEDIGNILEQFWRAEHLSEDTTMTEEERKCEEIFKSTTTRREDGKFEVAIPFKTDPPDVGPSRAVAAKRLSGVEARLNRNEDLREKYEEFMDEYEQQGHMTPAQDPEGSFNYLPHHPVIRQSALTTKVRVVFDASCKTANGKSLNSEQLVGPVVQKDLVSILLHFRLHKIAINGDVQAMYRQIWVKPEHQQYQCILWKRRKDDPVTTFKLTTVTYGTASAPYLATRCLKQIAEDTRSTNPEVADIIQNDFYVDDLLSGGDSIEEARSLQEQVIETLATYGFPLRKLASNEEKVIQAMENTSLSYSTNPEPIIKTLGLQWNRSGDAFGYKIQLKDNPQFTKRKLLSEVATIFDPLGYAAPVTVTAKMFLQQIWALGHNWDDPLPSDILTTYEEFRQQLPSLEKVVIPRWTQVYKQTPFELHGFCDASEKAYAACVYLRVHADGMYHSNLLAAKTKVAPLKTITLPRLELCGAVLLSQLMKHVTTALRRDNISIYAWCDSTITLAWINGQPQRFKTFVAHRITQIQDIIPPSRWRHVKSEENPADLASRGIMPQELFHQKMWFNGPTWLQREFQLPDEPKLELENLPEVKAIKCNQVSIKSDEEFIKKYSSWNKLLRITALIRRFYNCKRKQQHQSLTTGVLTVLERREAFHTLMKMAQCNSLSKERAALEAITLKDSKKSPEKHQKVLRKSKIHQLSPFLDKDTDLIRVGGRLKHSTMAYAQKHPIILTDSHITRLYLEHLHVQHLHCGPTHLLSSARQRVWIIRGKDIVRQIVRKCHVCTRWRGDTANQQMGNLPEARVQANRPFHTVGIDYAGPVLLKHKKGRGIPTHKGWICIFVCFATKAVHIEAVTEETTEAFIAALRRFIARRSRPAAIYSDNATTFVGAESELKNLWNQETHQRELANIAAELEIQWHFIPPRAPHQGGLWEAAVKSAKYHLKRILGEGHLTYEELTTVLCQIEAQLNSRPLCPLNEDASEPQALTPGHFLVFQAVNQAPDPDLSGIKENRLSRWQYLQRISQSFWKKWHMDYLSSLQTRVKWQDPQGNLTKGQLVIMKEDNMPPATWKLGVLDEVHPGSDGQTRVVTVRTTTKDKKGNFKVAYFKRPIVKVIPLIDTECQGGEYVHTCEQTQNSE